ncbi:MAG TPA: NAD(P)-binding protein [Chitinophagaceae bacterium]|nr:NAD(P)-binding protein [Chitinophagaceae bacterium]
MKRRRFLKLSLAAVALNSAVNSCQQKRKIKGSIVGASASVGHLLRDQSFNQPTTVEQKKLVIIGGGVSGLSAARFVAKAGLSDFVVLDLEKSMGGNAASGKNEISAYPWGAHYVPIPNNVLTDYLAFLKEGGVITEFNESGLPVYNEYYLCFDAQDRLYINGQWQEGLVPQFGVPDQEKKQVERFHQLMDEYRYKTGRDGRDAFAIPVDTSSRDKELSELDKITMKQWLIKNGFDSHHLKWYINYCTRDDFGTTYDEVSAWAGIHYFASRKGKGVNAKAHDILTWPEGNNFLVQQLQRNLEGNLRTESLVVRVKQAESNILIDYLDVRTRELKRIEASQCIMAVPQFIACRLLNDSDRSETIRKHFHYMPWMVANLTVKDLQERSGAPLSWDNVLYESESLGYVEASHQLVQGSIPRKNLTYYLPLTKNSVAEERKAAQKKTHEEWVRVIVDDLRKVHPNIEDAMQEVNVMIWGHAMVQPLPGLIHGALRPGLSQSINNKVHFAHTDLAGISIFEEGFYQGLNAAKKVMDLLS